MSALSIQDYLANGISYEDYVHLLKDKLNLGLTTDGLKDESLVNYSKLNFSRKKRLSKTLKLGIDYLERVERIEKEINFLVITEGWCGDAAQILPILDLIVKSNSHFESKVVLREEHPELMEAYSYNGTKSIPIIIGFELQGEKVLFQWGPRPEPMLELTRKWKIDESYSKVDFSKDLQDWYNTDKGRTTVEEIVTLLEKNV